MAAPRVISWLPLNNTLIAPSQSLAAAGNLQLNSKVTGQPQGAFIYDKVIRQVSLTSSMNESGVNFTINGIGSPVDGNGNPTAVIGPISEVLVGPNVNTVESVNIYSQVTSITANGAVGNISAGSGANGITDLFFLNTNSIFGGANCSIQMVNNVALLAAGYFSLNKPQVPDINYGNLVPSPFLATEFIAPTGANTFNPVITPSAVVWLSIVGTTTDSLFFTVLEQGVYP